MTVSVCGVFFYLSRRAGYSWLCDRIVADFTDSSGGHPIPAALAFLLVRLLEALQPWRLTGGVRTRDVWRVAAVLLVMPWSLFRWRRIATRSGPCPAALRSSAGGRHTRR